jgi:nucleotide-binding universal stress UspA family protein
MRTKHILVPLDLVRGPAAALAAVQQMAADTPVCITLLNVIDLNIYPPPQKSVIDELCSESQAALRKLAKLFFGAAQAARISVRLGRPADEIIAEAKAHEADLIVMCGPKAGRLRLFRRGTTQQILSSASCPALVLPHPGKPASQEPTRVQPNFSGEACLFGTAAPLPAMS